MRTTIADENISRAEDHGDWHQVAWENRDLVEAADAEIERLKRAIGDMLIASAHMGAEDRIKRIAASVGCSPGPGYDYCIWK